MIFFKRNMLLLSLSVFTLSSFTAGCGDSNPTSFVPNSSVSAPVTSTKSLVVEAYAQLVYANYSDVLSLVQTLQESINRFVANPSEENLQKAKQAWLNSREFYGQTEAFRFYDGPIDEIEPLINAWPIDEAYIDYVEGNLNAGIINNTNQFPNLTKEILRNANGANGDTNISTGFHAIEFLLWGQDLSGEILGSGQRSYTDYITDGNGSHSNQARRGQYLKLLAEMLVEDIQQVAQAWDPNGSNNYRKQFTQNVESSLELIMKGLGSFSTAELGGERITVAYDTKSQEDEHSCFSDNTHRDFIANQKGVINIYTGTYKRLDGSLIQGPGLESLVNVKDPTLNQKLKDQLAVTAMLFDEIAANAPFDLEILGDDSSVGRIRILKTIQALAAQSKSLSEVAALLK